MPVESWSVCRLVYRLYAGLPENFPAILLCAAVFARVFRLCTALHIRLVLCRLLRPAQSDREPARLWSSPQTCYSAAKYYFRDNSVSGYCCFARSLVVVMDAVQLFLERYNTLYEFWLAGTWESVPEHLMRKRPHPQLNSIAWNLWHIARVEDAGLNRFVAGRPQVLDDGAWMQRMNLPWRHHGSGMTLSEVDELNQRVDLAALREYSLAVQMRTRDILAQMQPESLSARMQPDSVRAILVDEGLAHRQAAGLLETYSGWTKGKCLMTFGLTHSYHHVGVVEVLGRLLGVEY